MDNVKKYGLKEQVALLPLSPGVYQFLDKNGTIIYVGKAKSLRKRVSSYFMQNKEHSAKVQVLVRQIAAIRHIVVDTETDALLLENSLIKTLQPRYNILLKDDKTYPWIVVRREPFPRVQSTRILNRDGSQYFGPYGSVMMQRSILEFIREVIPLRTCSLNLSPTAIAKGRYSVCLQYHLGNCKGPCVGAQSEEEYDALVDMTVSILKGDLRPVRTYLEKEMEAAAQNLKFEVAQRYKTRLDAVHPHPQPRRLPIFRSLRLGNDAAQYPGVYPRGDSPANLLAQPFADGYRQRALFGLPAIPPGQLQGTLRGSAKRRRIRRTGRYDGFDSQRRPAPRAYLS